MIVLTMTIASLLYLMTIRRWGSVLTPDGLYYGAMSNDIVPPLPYRLRMLPYAVRSLAGWRALHAGSYLALIAATFAAVQHVSPAHATPAALTLAALPSVRQSTAWPVLLDMPHWACIAIAVAVAQVAPLAAVAIIVATAWVTERTPVIAAVAAWPWIGNDGAAWAIFGGALFTLSVALNFRNGDTGFHGKPYWLRHPLRAALEHHRKTTTASWWLPWGGLALALPVLTPWAMVALVVTYGQCLIAQDRARLFTSAMLPVVLCMTSYEPAVLWCAAVITYFTPSTEV